MPKVLATNCEGQSVLLEVRDTSSTAKTSSFLHSLLHEAALRASPGGVSGCITDTAASCQRCGLRGIVAVAQQHAICNEADCEDSRPEWRASEAGHASRAAALRQG